MVKRSSSIMKRILQLMMILNCRMPKCNTVLQSEDDLFEPEIQPNSHGNC